MSMKIVRTEFNSEEELMDMYSKYHSVDWKEAPFDVLQHVNTNLKTFGLGIEIFEDGTDSVNFRVVKIKK